MKFKETTHLTLIIEKSNIKPTIIFKYSNNCGSSDRLKKEIESKKLKQEIYLVTVQNQPVLSKNISEWFNIKHETPQIIVLDHGKVIYSADHNQIDLSKII